MPLHPQLVSLWTKDSSPSDRLHRCDICHLTTPPFAYTATPSHSHHHAYQEQVTCIRARLRGGCRWESYSPHSKNSLWTSDSSPSDSIAVISLIKLYTPPCCTMHNIVEAFHHVVSILEMEVKLLSNSFSIN